MTNNRFLFILYNALHIIMISSKKIKYFEIFERFVNKMLKNEFLCYYFIVFVYSIIIRLNITRVIYNLEHHRLVYP